MHRPEEEGGGGGGVGEGWDQEEVGEDEGEGVTSQPIKAPCK